MKAPVRLTPILNEQVKVSQNNEMSLAKPSKVTLPDPKVASNSLTESDYRLVIERNSATGSYIYKTLNAFTGEVVSQRPAEAVAKLSDSGLYSPGTVINAKA
jgi:flagellar protein FlaG